MLVVIGKACLGLVFSKAHSAVLAICLFRYIVMQCARLHLLERLESNMTMVIFKHFRVLIFMESFV